ncbi:hypothetical protein, partial [Candidatus Cyrtobacter comes]
MYLIDAKAIKARKERSDFSNRNAKRRFSLSLAKKFSILLRNLNLSLSYSIGSMRFFRPGITGILL